MTRQATVRAFAKINLSLLVLGKRADGYHELRTVFQSISLADRIRLEWTPGACWAVEATPEIGNNLAVKAAEVLRSEAKLRGHLKIHIDKKIPMGGGLGGGSSNAAALLLALPVLAGVNVPVSALAGMATAIGSDVPFFLEGGTTLALGRGEEMYAVPTPKQRHAVVVTPGISVSTPEAFRALGKGPVEALTFTELSNRIKVLRDLLSALSVSLLTDCDTDWRECAENDFEPVVFKRHKRLGTLRRELERRGARPARMSGSGSSLFGVFPSREEQLAVVKAMAPDGARSARLMSRNEYRGAWFKALAEHKVGNAWPPHSRYANSK